MPLANGIASLRNNGRIGALAILGRNGVLELHAWMAWPHASALSHTIVLHLNANEGLERTIPTHPHRVGAIEHVIRLGVNGIEGAWRRH